MKSPEKLKKIRGWVWQGLFVSLLLASAGCVDSKKNAHSLRVLSYSSLGSKGGFLPSVSESFERESGCTLKIESTLGATQMVSMLSDLSLENHFDVVMGVDELLYDRLQDRWATDSYGHLKLKERLEPLVSKRLKPGWIPLDFGAMSFVYRKSLMKGLSIPRSLKDLLSPQMRKKFIVQDPRASAPGLLFFLLTESALKLSDLRSAWRVLAPSWDSSYKMFLSGDAPMVWSYVSSLAYHASRGELEDFSVVEFEEGLPVQVEGMGVLKSKKGNPCVGKWIDFMLKTENLSLIAEKQFMWPAFKGVPLPPFFDQVPALKKVAEVSMSTGALDRILQNFERVVQGNAR